MKKCLLKHVAYMTKLFFIAFIFQCMTMSLLLAWNGNAQVKSIEEVEVKLSLNRVSAVEAFQKLEKATEFSFVFATREIKDLPPISFKSDGKSLYDVLLDLAYRYNLNFKQIDENIHVKKSDNKKNPVITRQDRVLIKGLVLDPEGAPLPGVSVLVKGTTIGTATDVDGTFSLNVPEGGVLRFSFIGFITQEIGIGNQTNIDLVMEYDDETLDEVVVTGYGTQQKIQMTGAISAVTSKDIEKTTATTTADALVGRIPGVTSRTTNSYEGDSRPGSASQLQIRNMGDPLYVIDGVPQSSGQFNNLNINDIDKISVLKDASAAIYGIRAANGVVLVTTKRGKANQPPVIRLSGYYGIQNNTTFPFDPPANAYTFKRSQAEIQQNRGQVPTISPEELEKWKQGTEPGFESYNQYDNVFNNPNAAQYSVNASASGGSEDITYFFSAGHVSQDYLMKGHTFNRTNIQANLKAKLHKGLSVGTQISARIENRDNVAIPGRDDPIWNALLGTNSSWPMENIYANGNPNYINGDVRFLTRLPSTYTREIAGFQEDQWSNFTGNFFAEYEFDFGLTARATYSYSKKLNTFERQRFSYDAYGYNEEEDEYFVNGGFASPLRTKNNRIIKEQFSQIQLSYSKDFTNHSISGVLAFEMADTENNFIGIESIPANNYTPLINFIELNDFNNTWSTSARTSYVGKVSYDYKKKYLLDVLGRYDGSYLYAPDKRWGLFPGVSVGWRIIAEKFMEGKFNFLTELKLRGSWGQAGQEVNITPWGYLAGADFRTSQYLLDGNVITGARPRGIPVTNLSWAKSTTTDIGLEVAFLDNKLFGEFDLFERRLTGLPAAKYDVLLPSEVGYSLPLENLESEALRGVEGMIGYRGGKGPLKFSFGINGTLARRRILDPYLPRFENSWDEYRNGTQDRWAGVSFGYEVIGRFQTQEEIDNFLVNTDGQGNTTLLPGDFQYKDANGDGIINSMDMRPIGYNLYDNPILSYGINGSFNYKAFDFSFGFNGGSFYSFSQNLELKFPFQGGHNSPEWLLNDRWHRADLFNPDSEWVAGRYPVHRQNSGHANYRQSDFWRRNVNYLRLKRMEFGYTIQPKILSSIGISSARFYANGTNLFSLDNMKDIHLDPELAIDSGLRYPTQRVITVGFDITL